MQAPYSSYMTGYAPMASATIAQPIQQPMAYAAPSYSTVQVARPTMMTAVAPAPVSYTTMVPIVPMQAPPHPAPSPPPATGSAGPIKMPGGFVPKDDNSYGQPPKQSFLNKMESATGIDIDRDGDKGVQGSYKDGYAGQAYQQQPAYGQYPGYPQQGYPPQAYGGYPQQYAQPYPQQPYGYPPQQPPKQSFLNKMESATGLDIDRDGDKGVQGSYKDGYAGQYPGYPQQGYPPQAYGYPPQQYAPQQYQQAYGYPPQQYAQPQYAPQTYQYAAQPTYAVAAPPVQYTAVQAAPVQYTMAAPAQTYSYGTIAQPIQAAPMHYAAPTQYAPMQTQGYAQPQH